MWLQVLEVILLKQKFRRLHVLGAAARLLEHQKTNKDYGLGIALMGVIHD